MSSGGATWNEARVLRLEQLWNQGMSAAGIARALGEVSRSAVLGKLLRQGLLKTRRPASAPRRFGEGSGAEDAKLAAAHAPRRERSRAGELSLSPWREEAFLTLAGTAPRPWLTRAPGECAFPVGGAGEHALSCCAPRRSASAYCARHHAIVFRPAPPTRAPLPAERQAARSQAISSRSFR